MKHTLAIGAMAAVLTMGLDAAQQKPDFSGRWTTEAAPAATPAATQPGAPAAPPRGGGPGRSGDMGSGWGSPITITQDAAKLTLEYAFFARGDMQPPLRFVYALDGTESRNSVMMGRGIQLQVSKTSWDGDKLVITTTHSLVDPSSGKPTSAVVTQTLSLESPTSLVVESTRAGVFGGPTTNAKTVYRKM
jgi:hypothetical protein